MREPVCLADLPAGVEANVATVLTSKMQVVWEALADMFTMADIQTFCPRSSAYLFRARALALGLIKEIEPGVFQKTGGLISEAKPGLYAKMVPDSDRVRVLGSPWSKYWIFRNRVVHVEDTAGFAEEELLLYIKHFVRQAESKLNRIKSEIEAFENLEQQPSGRRERIPEAVQILVYERDGGKCVKCGSKEKLHFDHIIPVSKGGSSTDLNIQLLCQRCNLKKHDSIG